jgi:glycosyltransferase involved in cell wall biosynthesis
MEDKVKVSWIIGSFNRPNRMRTCLASIVDQDFSGEWEAVVTDNSDDPECRRKIEELCQIDPRIRYEWTHDRALTNFPRVGIPSLYDAAEIGVGMTTGEWLAWPNCDSYYCPHFLERMLAKADADNLEFVYCNCILGRQDRPYHALDSQPWGCAIDKTSYMIRREWFPEQWPGKVELYGVADGVLVNELVAKGIRHGKVNEIFVVHN